MKIEIHQLLEGARAAIGTAVIIDVFRAFTVEAYAAANGAARIIPVGTVEEAFRLRQADPAICLIGERNGRKVEGFDFGNAPSQVAPVDFTGRTVVHTTSAGTQGIANAVRADEILSGALVNAAAIARYLKAQNPETVSLCCMGWNAREETEEDTLCALYIKSLLEDRPLSDLQERLEHLRTHGGAKFFDPVQQEVFPMGDYPLCTNVDAFDFVLRLTREEETGLKVMEKICC